MNNVDRILIRALKKSSNERNSADVDLIVQYIVQTGCNKSIGLHSDQVRAVALNDAHYDWRDADEELFNTEHEPGSVIFILLSGLVYVDSRLAYPGAVIKPPKTAGRPHDSIVLEPSEFLSISLNHSVGLQTSLNITEAVTNTDVNGNLAKRGFQQSGELQLCVLSDPFLEESSVDNSEFIDTSVHGEKLGGEDGETNSPYMPTQIPQRLCTDNNSLSSFTSSSFQRGNSLNNDGSSITDDIDLTGLTESAVDSDDDLLNQEDMNSNSEISDVYRECLEKNPGQRSEREIDLLVDFVENFPAFADLTHNAKRSLCQVMTYAVVEECGAVILSDGDEIDSWSVVINGSLEHRMPDGQVRELGVGESFGIESTRDKPPSTMRNKGVFSTLAPYCQFIVVSFNDYVAVLSRAEQDKQVILEKGHAVLVMEERDFTIQPGLGSMPQFVSGSRLTNDQQLSTVPPRSLRMPVVIRGTIDKLIELVVPQENVTPNYSDPTFAEDFLMTFPLFLNSVTPVCACLLQALKDTSSSSRQKKAANVITHWISADFALFERVSELGDFLENVEQLLEEMGLVPQLKLILLATHSRSRPRHVVVAKSSKSEQSFHIAGGLEHRAGIFVCDIEKDGAACRAGLRRGDQILHVNNHDFSSVSHNRALDILLTTNHLAMTVKYNKLGLHSISGSTAHGFNTSTVSTRAVTRPSLPTLMNGNVTGSSVALKSDITPSTLAMKTTTTTGNMRSSSSAGAENSGQRNKFSRLVAKVSKKFAANSKTAAPSIALVNTDKEEVTPISNSNGVQNGTHLARSRSNPDLVSGILPKRSPFPEPPDQAVLVFTPDQDHRYFLIRSDTTASDLIAMTVREFGLTNKSSLEMKAPNSDPLNSYSLFEVTVHPKTQSVRTRRLLDDRSDLAERLPVYARYYLRRMTCNLNNSLMGSAEVAEVISDMNKSHLLTMRPRLVAIVLTLAEFEAFEQIQPLDYIDDVLELTGGGRSSKINGKACINGGGHARVEAMTVLSNRQLFWVVTEIIMEQKLRRRVHLVQFFIKLAGFCLRLNNFESTFAVVAGLGHSAVVRLNSTWARVSPKYKKLLEDYRELFDPSRNMSRYRNHIAKLQRNGRLCPAIPLFPLVKKDLAFVHLGNSTFVCENDSAPSQKTTLVNVEKLRMLGREIRQIRQLCSERYPGKELFDQVYFNAGANVGHKGVVAGLSGGWLTLGRKKSGHHLTRSNEGASSSGNGPKQIFSAMRARKQIEFYLNSRLLFPPSRTAVGEAIPVIDDSDSAKVLNDERQLMMLSKQCEPDVISSTTAPGSASKVIRQQQTTLPTPTTPVAPKFGTAEGQNISKMMSLCKEVKPHSEKAKAPLITSVNQSPAPAAHQPMIVRSPTTNRASRNLIYQYVLQQHLTDIHAELRRRPIARLSSESSSVVPAASSRSQSSASSAFSHI